MKIPLDPEDYLIERNLAHESRFPSCRPLPGVLKLLTHLSKHQILMAVATSSHQKPFGLKTSQNQALFSLFNGHVITGDDKRVTRGKPDPQIFQVAAASLLINPSTIVDSSNCLVFEDAPSGVRAGLAAGMKVIWIPDSNLVRDPELAKQCAAVLSSLEEFEPEKFGLPPYSS